MRKFIVLVLCFALFICMAAGVAAAEDENQNKYTIFVEADGSVYKIYMTQTDGSDPVGFLSLEFGRAADYVSGFPRAAGINVFATENGFRLTKASGTLAPDANVKTLLAEVTLAAPCTVTYDTANDFNGVTNSGYRVEATLTVKLPTAVPQLSASSAVLSGNAASFALSSTPADGTTFKVYNADGNEASGVTAEVSDGKLALTFTNAPTVATNYYISAASEGLSESAKLPVSVYVVNSGVVSLIVPAGTQVPGSDVLCFTAQYSQTGQMLKLDPVVAADLTAPQSVTLISGAASCAMFLLGENLVPLCPAPRYVA